MEKQWAGLHKPTARAIREYQELENPKHQKQAKKIKVELEKYKQNEIRK
jgi:hypothetical protein